MDYLKKSFSVSYGINKEYRDNFDKIDWSKKEEKNIEEDEPASNGECHKYLSKEGCGECDDCPGFCISKIENNKKEKE